MPGNYHQSAESIDHTPTSDIAAGTCVLLGTIVAFFERAVLANELGTGKVAGVIKYTKAASQAWTIGAKVYWDDTAKEFTTTAGGNTLCGIAWAPAASGAGLVTGYVLLNSVN